MGVFREFLIDLKCPFNTEAEYTWMGLDIKFLKLLQQFASQEVGILFFFEVLMIDTHRCIGH